MVNTSYKFMILEDKATGKRRIEPTTATVDEKLHDICAYASTREGCYPLLFLMKPGVPSL